MPMQNTFIKMPMIYNCKKILRNNRTALGRISHNNRTFNYNQHNIINMQLSYQIIRIKTTKNCQVPIGT